MSSSLSPTSRSIPSSNPVLRVKNSFERSIADSGTDHREDTKTQDLDDSFHFEVGVNDVNIKNTDDIPEHILYEVAEDLEGLIDQETCELNVPLPRIGHHKSYSKNRNHKVITDHQDLHIMDIKSKVH